MLLFVFSILLTLFEPAMAKGSDLRELPLIGVAVEGGSLGNHVTVQVSSLPSDLTDGGDNSQAILLSQEGMRIRTSSFDISIRVEETAESCSPPLCFLHEEPLIKILFNKIYREEDIRGVAGNTIRSMAERGSCLATLAMAILYKTGKRGFEKDERKAEGYLTEAYPGFLSLYKTRYQTVYSEWHQLLFDHGFEIHD